MIHLRPITPEERSAYHAFRMAIYANSRVSGFIDTTSGTDIDRHDARAQHFGWFPNGELKACVRLVEPDETGQPLPLFGVVDPYNRELALRFIQDHRQQGHRLVEASRLCLAPEHRSLGNAMRFVMDVVRCAHEQGIDHGIFDLNAHHRDFYVRMGFTEIDGGRPFQTHFGPSVLMTYDHEALMARRQGKAQLGMAPAMAA